MLFLGLSIITYLRTSSIPSPIKFKTALCQFKSRDLEPVFKLVLPPLHTLFEGISTATPPILMETAHKAKGHKNFYIDLDAPSDYLYTDGDIVSGKCVLLSTKDEDVGTIILTFRGVVKNKVYVDGYGAYLENPNITNTIPNRTGERTNWLKAEDVLFEEKRTIYEGTYTLRKNVPYEWPFEFQLPNSVVPSGVYNEGTGSSKVVYELEAARTRTWQDPDMIERQMEPRSLTHDARDIPGASVDMSGLFRKMGSFIGIIANTTLKVVPPRPKHVLPDLTTVIVERRLPLLRQGHSSGSHGKFSSLLHLHHDEGGVPCTIILEVSRNLVHGARIPFLLQVGSNEATTIPPVSVISVEAHLKSYLTLHDDTRSYHEYHESKVPLLDRPKTNLSLIPNTWLDLSSALDIQVDPTITPTFSHSLIELEYKLEAHIALEVGGKKFKEVFLFEGVRVLSSRVKLSPITRDFYCTFPHEHHNSKFGAEREDIEIGQAYLALSRLLSDNNIRHSPIASLSGIPTIILHGPSRSLPPPTQAPSAVPQSELFKNGEDEEILSEDLQILDGIIDGCEGFRGKNFHKKLSHRPPQTLAYLWHQYYIPGPYKGHDAPPDSSVNIRIEISGKPPSLTFQT